MDFEELLRKLVQNPDYTLTQDEATHIWREHNRLIEGNQPLIVLSLLQDKLTRELALGDRCAVCGRYRNPACITEC